MRRLLILVTFYCTTIFLVGCERIHLRAQLKEMTGRTVVLPPEVTCVYNGSISQIPTTLLDNKAKFVVYVDSTECSLCKVSKLVQYESVIRLSRESGTFDLLFLLCPKRTEYQSVCEYLEFMDYTFPVYLDDLQLFRKNNPFIPNDIRFHSFFVDAENVVQVVGDPVLSPNIMNLINALSDTGL